MNILLAISSLHFGGAEKQVIDDANQLCKKHNIIVLAFGDGHLKELLSDPVNVIIINKKNYLNSALELASIIRKNKTAIIHAHLYAPMIISALAGMLTNTPVIWNFHSHAYENSFKAKILHKLTAKLPSVKKILFPATELDDYYKEQGYGFGRRKCQLAYNSGQEIEQTDNRLKNSDNDIHLGFIGRVIPLKRINILIELAQFLIENKISNFKIDIVGNGSEMDSLKQQTNNLNLQNFITFHGFQHDTISFYKQFDIFVFPSGEEVLSLSLIDAGLCSLPSVAFDIGGNEEIIRHGETGFLVKTKENFFKQIILLIQQKSLRKEMGIAARKMCYNKFSPKARLDYLNALYEEFV